MHKERSVSIDTDCNMGPGKGEGCLWQAVHTQSMSRRSSKLFHWQHID